MMMKGFPVLETFHPRFQMRSKISFFGLITVWTAIISGSSPISPHRFSVEGREGIAGEVAVDVEVDAR